MKKSILILVMFLFSGVMALYGKRISHLVTPKAETKTVRFSVFAGTDYSTPLYKKSRAKVVLTICRYSADKQEIVWEGIVDKGFIKKYPGKDDAIFREVSIHNVYDRSETLAAYYKVVYEYKGSEITYEEGVTLSAGSATDSLSVGI